MAELATLGAVASAIDLFVLATKIFSRYKEYVDTGHKVPKNLQSLANELPYLRDSLKRHAEEEQAALASGDTARSAFILQECQQYLTKLDTFINELIPAASDSRLEKVKKAIKSVRKDAELKQIQVDLHHQIATLTYGSSVTSMSRIAAHRCIGAAPEIPTSFIRNAPLRPTYGFPATKVAKFIGRRGLVDQVAQSLMTRSAERTVIVLQGMGGQGKTQTALEVCSREDIRCHFKPILWVNASTEDSTAQAFEHFAVQMAERGSTFDSSQCKIDYVKERLEDHNRPSLLVFDNYDNLTIRNLNIRSYYPDDCQHAILVTSRHEDSVNLGDGTSVKGMDKDEAVALLLHRSQLKDRGDQKRDAQDIVSHLGYLPLAIAQAGAYINMKKIPLHDFIDHYNRRTAAVLKQTPEFWEYGLSVFTTWELSMSSISDDAQRRDHIDNMLLFCAILNHDNINEQFLNHLLASATSPPPWTEPFMTSNAWDSSKLQDTIAELGRLSLVQILRYKSGHYEFSIHPLVSDWLRLRVEPLSLCRSIESTMCLIANFIKSKSGPQMTFEVRHEVRTYVWSCLERLRNLGDDVDAKNQETDKIMDSKLTFAKFMSTDSQSSNATRLLEESLPVLRRTLGDAHPTTMDAYKELVLGYSNLYRYEEAENLIRTMSTVPSEKFSCALADCLSAQGKYTEAEEAYENLLPRLKSELGSCNHFTITCMNNMANNYTDFAASKFDADTYDYVFSDDCNKAEDLWLAIVMDTDMCATDPGQEGYDESIAKDLASIHYRLAQLYHNRGLKKDAEGSGGAEYFAKAVEMHYKGLSASEGIYGADNATVLTMMHNLAVSLNLGGDLERSEIYYQRTLEGYEQLYGPDHQRTVEICHCYGHVLACQSKLLEGVTLHKRSYEGLEAACGSDDEQTLAVFQCLINLNDNIGNMLEVETLYKRALTARSKSLGKSHKITQDTAIALGALYLKQERYDSAGKAYQHVVDLLYEENNQPSDTMVLWDDNAMGRALYGLATALERQQLLTPAKETFETLLGFEVDRWGAHHERTCETAANLAVVLEALGEVDEAEAVHRRFEEGYDNVLRQAEDGGIEISMTELTLGEEGTKQ